MALRFRFPVYRRVPRPWAAMAFLVLLVLALLLFFGRSHGVLRYGPILAIAPDFYTHVSNFSISYLLCTAIGYQWLMTGVSMKPVVLLALAIMLCNVVYEGFVPVINTLDSIDAGYGLVGTALGLLVLIAIDRYGLVCNPARGKPVHDE